LPALLAAEASRGQEGRRVYPDDVALHFQERVLRREQGNRHGAISTIERLLATREGEHFASVDAGLRGHKARHNLRLI
jgi:hypothetical protein